jgi:hypothetical protein
MEENAMAKKGFIFITAVIMALTARIGLADLKTRCADAECFKKL